MKKWEVKGEIPSDAKENLAEFPPLLQHMLYQRGILDKESAEKFLYPKYAELHDPFLIKDMEKAVDRIIDGIKKEERIVIYGDYDCDGIPGSVILNDFFREI